MYSLVAFCAIAQRHLFPSGEDDTCDVDCLKRLDGDKSVGNYFHIIEAYNCNTKIHPRSQAQPNRPRLPQQGHCLPFRFAEIY